MFNKIAEIEAFVPCDWNLDDNFESTLHSPSVSDSQTVSNRTKTKHLFCFKLISQGTNGLVP